MSECFYCLPVCGFVGFLQPAPLTANTAVVNITNNRLIFAFCSINSPFDFRVQPAMKTQESESPRQTCDEVLFQLFRRRFHLPSQRISLQKRIYTDFFDSTNLHYFILTATKQKHPLNSRLKEINCCTQKANNPS